MATTVRNDTFGEMTRAELDQLRATAHPCTTCGMLADVDPVFHAARYGHAPAYRLAGAVFTWDGRLGKWVNS
jgi:hypothetical protein